MKVVIAGGGTGGHLFPGIALAEELLTRAPNRHDVLFVGTEKGIESRVIPQSGWKLECIEITGLKNVGFWKFLKGTWGLPKSVIQALSILRKYKPDVVVGVGGYASGPVAVAAWVLGIPIGVQEQNAFPGYTNRMLGYFAEVIFTAFPEASRHLPKDKVQMLGTPIRRKLLDNYLKSTIPHEKFNLLVFGGSQGSQILNKKMMDAVPFLKNVNDKMCIQHQTGEKDLHWVQQEYQRFGCLASVTGFIKDMSQAYAQADVIVCRAGATTLSELTVARRAAILVPFAAAADNHQVLNARSLVEAGAASMILENELTGERLAKEIVALMNTECRRKMERAAGMLGRPQAAKEIIDVLVEIVGRRQKPRERMG